MSHVSTGTVYRTPSGKYVRTYKTHNHNGHAVEYVQETPDINCATVVRGAAPPDSLTLRFGRDLTPVEVEITRTVRILG